jgi:ribosomal protein S27AE
MHHMDEVTCTRCGYNEVALVRKEMFGGGKYRKKWRCPRCSHTWETVDES